jgi:putative ABC transport system permease protein
VLQDIHHALRALRRSPGFTATVIGTLALSVALGTGLFATVDAIFFRPLAVQAPEALAYLYWTPGQLATRPAVLPRKHFEFLSDTPEAFSGVAGHLMWTGRVTAGDVAETLNGELVSANYFDVLGVRPILGRPFLPDEDRLGSPDLVVMIGHDLWTRRFNASPDVIGKTMRVSHQWLGTRDATIIGVLPRSFVGLNNPWTPSECWFTFAQATGAFYPRIAVGPVARLRAGVTMEQARAIVTTKARRLNTDPSQKDIHVVMPANRVRMPFDPTAAVLPARLTMSMILIVGIVMLATIANVSGLMNARSLGRLSEIFVRRALGAGTGRLARQLALEGLLLAGAAGLLGMVAATWLVGVFQHYTPERFAVRITLDARTWLFAAALCALIGLLVSAGPVLQGIRARTIDPGRYLRSVTERFSRRLLRSGLVLLQVTAAALLALIAAAHLSALLTLERRDLGYEPRGVVSLGVRLQPSSAAAAMLSPREQSRFAARARAFTQALLLRTQGVSGATGVAGAKGVQAIALASNLPLQVADGRTELVAVSQEAFLAGSQNRSGVETLTISPGYFATLRMRMLAGSDFDARDTLDGRKVAIVSQAVADQLWPGRDPIDRSVAVLSPFASSSAKIEWHQVIGVVNEISPLFREHGSAPFIYLPISQKWDPWVSYVLARVDGNPADAAQVLKQAIVGADALADVERIQTVDQMLGDLLYTRRLAATVLGAGASIAMVLALVGLYAVVSYSVSRRVHELGVRAVLGADRAALVWFVTREALAITVIGCGLGLTLAHVAIGASASLFEGMPRLDIPTAAAMLFVLGALVSVAAYVPARHAARIDPSEALRAL